MSNFSIKQIIRESRTIEQGQTGRDAAVSQFGKNGNQASHLASVLRLYNFQGKQEIKGALSFEQLQANTSLDDAGRKTYIQNNLKEFWDNPDFGTLTETQINGIITIHNKYAKTGEFFETEEQVKTFFDLSKQDRLDIKRELDELGINKNWQDLLVYHGMCSTLKGIFIATVFFAALVAGAYRMGWIGNEGLINDAPQPVINKDSVKIDQTVIPLIIDPEAEARIVGDKLPAVFLVSDTFNLKFPWKVVIDEKEGTGGNWFYRQWRNLGSATGLTTAEITSETRYYIQYGYSQKALANATIEGTIRDDVPKSVVNISGLKAISIPACIPKDGSPKLHTDNVDLTSDFVVEAIRQQARDSVLTFVQQRMHPANAYHDNALLTSVCSKQGYALTNIYYGGTARNPKLVDKEIDINVTFDHEMPAYRNTRGDGPLYNARWSWGKDDRMKKWFNTPAGSVKKVTLKFVKYPGSTEFVVLPGSEQIVEKRVEFNN